MRWLPPHVYQLHRRTDYQGLGQPLAKPAITWQPLSVNPHWQHLFICCVCKLGSICAPIELLT